MIKKEADNKLVIVGGGPVGSVLAIGLAQQGWQVHILEAQQDPQKRWGYDARTLAVNLGSYLLLKRLGIGNMLSWQPIHCIRVSQRKHFGTTELNAQEMDVEALGYTIIARDLGLALDEALRKTDGVHLSLGKSIESMQKCYAHGEFTGLKLATNNENITSQLVFACDGSHSTIRQKADIPTSKHNFRQMALLGKVVHEKPHNNTAHERFLDMEHSGVFAMLPLTDARESSLVWVMPEAAALQRKKLGDGEFMQECNAMFSKHLGAFTSIRDRADYPMNECIANHYYSDRTFLLGNAAHALHPIAGQGLNIGFRDVAALLACFKGEVVSEAVFLNWAEKRRKDSLRMSRLTHLMIKSFSHPVVSRFASASLLGLELVSPLKRAFSRYMMNI